MRKNLRENIMFIIGGIVIAIASVFNLSKLGNPYYVADEVGYWAGAAWMEGVDWSPIFSQLSYYGWGYGIILRLLFNIESGPIRYQLAVLINGVMLLSTYAILNNIIESFFEKINKRIINLFSCISVLYSYNLTYAHLNMSETLLIFLGILCVYYLKKIYENPDCVYGWLMIYLLIFWQLGTHLRTITQVVAVFLTLLYLMLIQRIKLRYFLLSSFAFFIILILTIYLRDMLIAEQYTNSNMEVVRFIGNESFTDRISPLKDIFTIRFWDFFVHSILGKIFYLLCSTCLLLGVTLESFLKEFILGFRTRCSRARYLSVKLYVLLSFLGALFISGFSMMYPGRIDQLSYGRYVENTLPVIICCGFCYVYQKKEIINVVIKYFLLAIILGILSYQKLLQLDLKPILALQSTWFAGVMPKQGDENILYFTIYSILFSGIIILIFYSLISKKNLTGYIFLGIVWIIASNRALDRCVYPEINRMNYIVEGAEIVKEEDLEIYVLPFDENVYNQVNIVWMQYQLGKKTLKVASSLDNIPQGGYLLLSNKYDKSRSLLEMYEQVYENEEISIIQVE